MLATSGIRHDLLVFPPAASMNLSLILSPDVPSTVSVKLPSGATGASNFSAVLLSSATTFIGARPMTVPGGPWMRYLPVLLTGVKMRLSLFTFGPFA